MFYDLVPVQYHSLKAGHDYGPVRAHAKNGGIDDIASFFEQVMKEDSARAAKCHQFPNPTVRHEARRPRRRRPDHELIRRPRDGSRDVCDLVDAVTT